MSSLPHRAAPAIVPIRGGLAGVFLVLLTGAAHAAEPITLEQVVALAIERNERARASAAEAEAAARRIERARAFFFPDLTITGTYTRRLHETVRTIGGSTVVIQRHNALAAQANLVVPLYDARLFPIYRQAKLEGEAADLVAAEQRRVLGYESADAFLMVLSQEQVVEAAVRRMEFSSTALRDMRARAEAGLVSSNDVTRGELEAVTAERELSATRASAAIARLELGYLVDTPIEGSIATPEALLTEAGRPPPRADALIAFGLERRLDITAGRSRVLALEAAAEEPARRVIPSLAGVAQYRVTNERGLAGRTGDGFAGLIAAWPLWDGGERSAERAERQALARAEAARQDGRVRAVALDVRRALVALENAQSTQRVAASAADIAARNVRETAELYRQGLVGALEVADANLRLFEAEVALARERYALALAYLDLRASTGDAPPGMMPLRTGVRP
jgi:outer membrane protein TolC